MRRSGKRKTMKQHPADDDQVSTASRQLPVLLHLTREGAAVRFRVFLQHDLTDPQWRVLRILSQVDELDVSNLAQRSYLMRESLSRILRDPAGTRTHRSAHPNTDARRTSTSRPRVATCWRRSRRLSTRCTRKSRRASGSSASRSSTAGSPSCWTRYNCPTRKASESSARYGLRLLMQALNGRKEASKFGDVDYASPASGICLKARQPHGRLGRRGDWGSVVPGSAGGGNSALVHRSHRGLCREAK